MILLLQAFFFGMHFKSFSLSWLAFLMVVMSFSLEAQENFRIKGKFSVKTKTGEKGNLTMGSFYHDANQKSIVYKISFPEKEVWVFQENQIHKVNGDSVQTQDSAMGVVDFSIFHLALTNSLSHYGLKDSPFKLVEVKKENDLVITTWDPPGPLKELVGKVMIANKNKRIQGIVFFDVAGVIIRKQFFRDYQKVGNLFFPTEIIDLFYQDGEISSRQITTYSELVLNATDENHLYNYTLPAATAASKITNKK